MFKKLSKWWTRNFMLIENNSIILYMKTPEEINEEISRLVKEKDLFEQQALQDNVFNLFQSLNKGEILLKIKEMLDESSLLRMEVERLLNK